MTGRRANSAGEIQHGDVHLRAGWNLVRGRTSNAIEAQEHFFRIIRSAGHLRIEKGACDSSKGSVRRIHPNARVHGAGVSVHILTEAGYGSSSGHPHHVQTRPIGNIDTLTRHESSAVGATIPAGHHPAVILSPCL